MRGVLARYSNQHCLHERSVPLLVGGGQILEPWYLAVEVAPSVEMELRTDPDLRRRRSRIA